MPKRKRDPWHVVAVVFVGVVALVAAMAVLMALFDTKR
jgi:hypothetical protein